MSQSLTKEQIKQTVADAEKFVAANPYPYYAPAWDLWTEQASPETRAILLGIRANTPGNRHATGEHDPSRPTLKDLSEDLRQLLDTSWDAWSKA